MNKIVYIVDDDPAICDSLSLLMSAVGMQTQTFPEADSFLSAIEPEQAGCLILDVRLPGMDGLELQQELQQRQIDIPILIITGHADVPMAVRAMRAGAIDFIEKPFDAELLILRIQECLLLSQQTRSGQQKNERLALLTKRERQVFELLVDGKLNKIIAHELGISIRTVEGHRANLMEKLQVKSLSELVRIALS